MTTGVTFLDHTADVGIDVEADDLEELFHRAALGMLALLRGHEDGAAEGEPDGRAGGDAVVGPAGAATPDPGADPGPAEETGPVPLSLEADGPPGLLAAWLRELLFLHETRRSDYVGAAFDLLEGSALHARVRTEPARRAVREIKGVTYHELAVRRAGDRWKARVIFDV